MRADVTLAHAVENVVDGAFFNSGQSCCGIERVYVDASVHEEFIDRAVERYQSAYWERAMAGLPGLEEVRSISRAGISVVTVSFSFTMGTVPSWRRVSMAWRRLR